MEREKLTNDVMNLMLSGDYGFLKLLRMQYRNAKITIEEDNSAGLYISFAVCDEKIRLKTTKQSFMLDNVIASNDEIDDQMGFILWVENGYITCLEGYVLGVNFPGEEYEMNVSYSNEREREVHIRSIDN